MDMRYNIYVQRGIDSILHKICNKHFPSYKFRFIYFWDWYIIGKACNLIIRPHADDHKHFITSNEMLDQIVDDLKNYEGAQDILSAVQNISVSHPKKQIVILFNVQTLVKNIS